MKKTVILNLLTAATTLGLTLPSAAQELPSIDTSQNVLPGAWIAVESKSKTGEFWTLVKQGMEDAVTALNEAYGFSKAERLTMTFEGHQDETDVEAQVNVLDALISENPSVLCLSVSDTASCQAQLESARENGIPVVIFDSTVLDEGLIDAYLGSDNQRMGSLAAEKLAEALDEAGDIAIFSGQEKTSPILERVNSFTESMEAYPEIQIISVLYEDQVEDMEEAIREVLAAHPQLKGVYCTNATSTDAYLSLSPELRASLLLVGTDATTAQQDAIRNQEEYGCVSQNPYLLGYQTILTAASMTAPPADVSVPFPSQLLEVRWIDAQTMELEENVNFLY